MDDTQIRQFLRSRGLPDGDRAEYRATSRFDDGADFRIEVPTVNSVEALEALLLEADKCGVRINRVTETLGLFRHTKAEILDYVSLANLSGIELLMSVGPRATYDTSASALTSQGKMMGYRLRGQEQIVRAIKDVARGVELGVRGFVIYDEGLLWLLAELRRDSALPADIHLKASAHLGYGNPTSIAVLERLGADSINPARDLQLPMIGALRQAVSVPLDIHTDNPAESGGFIRFYEVPQFVQLASPVYLKSGNSVVARHGHPTSPVEARAMAHQVAIVLEFLARELPSAIQSQPRRTLIQDVQNIRIAR